MKPENVTFQIELSKDYKRRNSLVRSYKELIFDVRISGESWAEYKIELIPNEDFVWNVLLIDSAEKHSEYLKDSFHKGIRDGLIEFKKQQNDRGIGMGGIDFRIENLSYSITDSKPISFQYTLLYMINALEKTSCFKKEILENELSSTYYNMKEVEFDKSRDHYLLKEIHNQIVIPRIFRKTIKLTKRVEIILKELGTEKPTYRVTLSPKLYDDRKISSLSLEIRDKIDEKNKRKFLSQLISLNNQIKEILVTLSYREYNLSGLYILVSPLYDKSKEFLIQTNKEYIKWAILNALLNEEFIEINEEKI